MTFCRETAPGFMLKGAEPPRAEQRPTARDYHGRRLDDPYAWLAAENWREVLRNPKALPKDIASLLQAENAYTSHVLAALKPLRKALVKEMRGRIKEDDSDPPEPDGPFAYYEHYRDGAEHPLFCRRKREGGDEEVLLDGEALAKGKDFFEIGDAAHSRDHAQLGWSADDTGSELYSIRTRAIADGRDRPDVVGDSDGTLVWSADAKSFLYARVDDNHRAMQVFRHVVGDASAMDRLVFEERDTSWSVSLSESRDGRFAIISVHGHDSTECHLVDLFDEETQPRMIAPREPRLRYEVEARDDRLYILANGDGAEDFALFSAPLASSSRADWRIVEPHRQGRMIESFTVYARHLVWLECEESLPRLKVRNLESGEEHAIAFAEEAYALDFDPGLEFDTQTLRFTYCSMTTPDETYDYDMETRARTLVKREEIPSGHDPKDYVTRRLFAYADDGESVPITLLHRADFTPGAGAPLLLYGYGAYGDSLSASFDSNALSLVDRGFVYALAHVRGGTDRGWRWYEQGKLEHKTNSFTDFIACARRLVELGYSHEGAIVAQGASAGGMLMGAVANLAPQLFAGIIAGVPFVDVLNTILRDDLPLTPPEWLEWGDPIRDASAYERLAAYSPYDNVRAQSYPPILALGALADPRVTYWEPLKWVQRLRATMSGGGPVVLHTQMGAGHAGASGRFERLDEIALEYAFAIACAGRLAEES